MGRKDWYEDVLPNHGINNGIGSLNASTESRYPGRDHYDSPLVQHRCEYDHHVLRVDCVKVFCEISL